MSELTRTDDTIVAIATAPGRGGVGIVRVSGPKTQDIAKHVLGVLPEDRVAHYSSFLSDSGAVLDQGLGLLFLGPNSLTGEDVLELQAHGSPVVLDQLTKTAMALGARMAEPGEFLKRAFLNEKVDLAQAEGIAALIESHSEQAAGAAIRSMQGDFSNVVKTLVDELTELRVVLEASLDFSDEDIEETSKKDVTERTHKLLTRFSDIYAQANQGLRLVEGMHVAIVGKPNVGKSSLLNRLAGEERAIVTNLAGTTRDVLRESILIDGLEVHLVDTAGLRYSNDVIEQEGVRRAWDQIEKAELILLVVDGSNAKKWRPMLTSVYAHLNERVDHQVLTVFNKTDLKLSRNLKRELDNGQISADHVLVSTIDGAGIDNLKQKIKNYAGVRDAAATGFSARRRHLDALSTAESFIEKGFKVFLEQHAFELYAEELKHAQSHLNTITGSFTSDDLLGKIFSSFCIGK